MLLGAAGCPEAQVYTVLSAGERTLQQYSAELALSALRWTSFCVSSFSTCTYPGKTSSPLGNQERGASDRELRAATVCGQSYSGYLPSCPVEAQHDMSVASLSYGSQPCLSTCTPLDPLVSAVPSEVPGASADTGQPRRRLAPECPREYGVSPLACPAYSVAGHAGMGLIQGGNQIPREKATQPFCGFRDQL